MSFSLSCFPFRMFFQWNSSDRVFGGLIRPLVKEHLYERESFLLCFFVVLVVLHLVVVVVVSNQFVKFPPQELPTNTPRITPKSGVLLADAFLKFGKAVQVAYPNMFHVFSRYILGCELRPVSSFGVSQPLRFTVSRHDWNEAKWFQRVEDFFWGQKWSWNNKKHIDGDKLRNTPQVARNKKWSPP